MPALSRSRMPGRRDERPGAHEQPRPVAVRERAEAAREHEHHQGHREDREPALERAVAGDLLQEDDEEEEEDASPAYMASVSTFPTAKLRRENSSSFSIGSRDASLVGDERRRTRRRRRRAERGSPGCDQP